jgi:hypothetical protein
MAVFTDATGAYVWSVPPGTYTLEASRDGYAPQQGEVTVDGGSRVTLDFQLAAP